MALANCTRRSMGLEMRDHCLSTSVTNQLVFMLDLSLLFFFFLDFVGFRGRLASLKWVLTVEKRNLKFL